MTNERTIKKLEDGSYDVVETSKTIVQAPEMKLFRQKLDLQIESAEKALKSLPEEIVRMKKELADVDMAIGEKTQG